MLFAVIFSNQHLYSFFSLLNDLSPTLPSTTTTVKIYCMKQSNNKSLTPKGLVTDSLHNQTTYLYVCYIRNDEIDNESSLTLCYVRLAILVR